MAFYEIVLEEMNPCGGEAYRSVHITEADTDDPVQYVRTHTDEGDIQSETLPGGSVQVTWSHRGYTKRFTFTK